MNVPRVVLTGAGLGLCPFAPGTVASAVTAVLGWWLLSVSVWAVALAGLVAVVLGCWASRVEQLRGDPGSVVIDEVAGQLLALLGAGSADPLWVLAGFALFRVFDIAKPGLVGWADRQTGPLWVMADDIIAGLLTAISLLAARHLAGLP
jgi:phosphatidylglycerophosphatase A